MKRTTKMTALMMALVMLVTGSLMQSVTAGALTKKEKKQKKALEREIKEQGYPESFIKVGTLATSIFHPVEKNYKGGVPKLAVKAAGMSKKYCFFYPGRASELELFDPTEVTEKVIEILKKRGYSTVSEALKEEFDNGEMTEDEYDYYLKCWTEDKKSGECSWVETGACANLKCDPKNGYMSYGYGCNKVHDNVDDYAKDIADYMEKRMKKRSSKRFDIEYTGIETYVAGYANLKQPDGTWKKGYTHIQVEYIWRCYC